MEVAVPSRQANLKSKGASASDAQQPRKMRAGAKMTSGRNSKRVAFNPEEMFQEQSCDHAKEISDLKLELASTVKEKDDALEKALVFEARHDELSEDLNKVVVELMALNEVEGPTSPGGTRESKAGKTVMEIACMSLGVQLEESKKEVKSSHAQVQGLHGEAARAADRLAQAHDLLAREQDSVRQLRRKYNEIVSQRDASRLHAPESAAQRLHAVQKHLEESSDIIKAQAKEQRDLAKEVAKMHRKLKDAGAERDRQAAELEATGKRAQALEGEVKSLQDKGRRWEEQQATIRGLKEAEAWLKASASVADKAQGNLKAELAACQKDLARESARAKDLQKSLSARDAAAKEAAAAAKGAAAAAGEASRTAAQRAQELAAKVAGLESALAEARVAGEAAAAGTREERERAEGAEGELRDAREQLKVCRALISTQASEMEELQEELAETSGRLARALDRHNEEIQQKDDVLVAARAEWKGLLAQAEANKGKLDFELGACRTVLAGRNEQLRALEAEAAQAKKEKGEMQQHMNTVLGLQARSEKEVTAQLKSCQKELGSAAEELKGLGEKLREEEAKCKVLEHAAREAEGEARGLQARLDEAEEAAHTVLVLRAENEGLQGQVTSLTAARRKLESELGCAQEDLDVTRQEVARLAGMEGALDDCLRQIKGEDALRATVKDLGARADEREARAAELESERAAVNARAAMLEEDKEAAAAALSAALSTAATAATRAEHARREAEEAQEARSTLARAVDSAMEQLEAVRGERDALRAQLAAGGAGALELSATGIVEDPLGPGAAGPAPEAGEGFLDALEKRAAEEAALKAQASREVVRLTGEVSRGESERRHLLAELDASREAQRSLQTLLRTCRRELEAAITAADRAGASPEERADLAEAARVQERVRAVEDELTVSRGEVAALTRALAVERQHARAAVAAMAGAAPPEREAREAVMGLALAKQQLAGAEEEGRRLRGELARHEEGRAARERLLGEGGEGNREVLARKVESLAGEVDAAVARAHASEQEHKRTQMYLDATEDAMRALREEMLQASREASRLRGAVSDKEEHIDTLTRSNGAKRDDIAALHEHLKDAQNQALAAMQACASKDERIASLAGELGAVQAALRMLRKESVEKEHAIGHLQMQAEDAGGAGAGASWRGGDDDASSCGSTPRFQASSVTISEEMVRALEGTSRRQEARILELETQVQRQGIMAVEVSGRNLEVEAELSRTCETLRCEVARLKGEQLPLTAASLMQQAGGGGGGGGPDSARTAGSPSTEGDLVRYGSEGEDIVAAAITPGGSSGSPLGASVVPVDLTARLARINSRYGLELGHLISPEPSAANTPEPSPGAQAEGGPAVAGAAGAKERTARLVFAVLEGLDCAPDPEPVTPVPRGGPGRAVSDSPLKDLSPNVPRVVRGGGGGGGGGPSPGVGRKGPTPLFTRRAPAPLEAAVGVWSPPGLTKLEETKWRQTPSPLTVPSVSPVEGPQSAPPKGKGAKRGLGGSLGKKEARRSAEGGRGGELPALRQQRPASK